MQSFSLTIDSHLIGKLVIKPGQGWLLKSDNSLAVNDFCDWLEGKKYYQEDLIKYVNEKINVTGVQGTGQYIEILRFRISANEGDDFYYQQRYHSTENENVETVGQYIGRIKGPYLVDFTERSGLRPLLNEKINMLSTGEFRKACSIKMANIKPDVAFIEEPYTGMDQESCTLLNELFEHLLHNGTSIVIFTSGLAKPEFIDHIIVPSSNTPDIGLEEIINFRIPDPHGNIKFDVAFELKNIVVRYDGRMVLQNVDWKVKRNSKWKLTGPNGAGKSTLLSLVNADNPQVYSNEVYLFDKKRGTGESIWDIKDRIGFYSTELHRYFDKHQSVEDAISSIVFHNPYRKRILTSEETQFKDQLFRYFDLSGSGQRSLYEFSAVYQKLIILSAVLIKNAPLLILDEPFQGFGNFLIRKAQAMINKYAAHRTFIMVSHNNTDFPDCINCHFHLNSGRGYEL